jgi:hypothetical protein
MAPLALLATIGLVVGGVVSPLLAIPVYGLLAAVATLAILLVRHLRMSRARSKRAWRPDSRH